MKLHQRALYESELPVAQQSAIIANQQRDTKKKTEPYKIEDFSLFKPVDNSSLPSSKYGSAAIAMIKNGTFPTWALFCYKELASLADSRYTPGVCALVSEDAILLHPVKSEHGYTGMLISRESAGGKRRAFVNDKGDTVWLTVPPVRTKVIAEEDVTLYP